MSDLKPLPCPFCGHTGLSFEEGSTFRWGVASCDGCDATCGEIRRNYPDDGKWHAEAIEAWNRRAQPAQAVRSKLGAGVPMTRQQTDAMFEEVQRRANQLADEGRYTFGGWFPIAVELIEAHHGIVGKEGA